MHPSSLYYLSLLILILLFSSQTTTKPVNGASPTFTTTTRPNSYQNTNDKYDRSISTFSNDGRLLQVEYSTNASNRGKVIIASIELDTTSSSLVVKKKWKNAVVVVMLKHTSEQQEEEESGVPLKEETQQMYVHRISPSTLLYTTGLKGDGRILATALRYNTASAKLQNGQESSVQEIAERLGRIQHELTWTAGARPLGITATLVGVDDDDGGKVKIYQCDPGGVVHPYSCCVSGGGGGGSGTSDVQRRDILDGLLDLSQELKEKVQQRLDDAKKEEEKKKNDDDDDDEFCKKLLTEMVQKVGKTVLNAASSSSSTFFIEEEDDEDDDDSSEENKEKKKKKKCKMDLWVIQPSSSSQEKRGNALIRYATDVTKDDLVLVSKRMFDLA